jgi:murein DD-endopeptidase MepM/ murein hydrolase activator NlpD
MRQKNIHRKQKRVLRVHAPDKKRELIENQRVYAKRNKPNESKRMYVRHQNSAQNSAPSLSIDVLQIRKNMLLLLSLGLIVSSFGIPLMTNINSYFWEKKRVLKKEQDVVYNLFLIEGMERNTDDARPVSDEPFSLPSLKTLNYVVKKGDSLFGISHRFNVSVDAIITANNLKNAQYIKIGTELEVPTVSGIFYTVKRGDSLSSLSSRYGVSVNEIADVNDLSSSVIQVKQRLFIPGGSLSTWERAEALGNIFKNPVKGRLTSKVGFRIDPFTKKPALHAGIDLANRIGTSVRAAQYGRVIYTGYRGNYGKSVIIIHPQGYKTLYAHLNKINVKKGQTVQQGEQIGQLGNSGRSTGPHLHFEVYQNGRLLDPLKVVKLR